MRGVEILGEDVGLGQYGGVERVGDGVHPRESFVLRQTGELAAVFSNSRSTALNEPMVTHRRQVSSSHFGEQNQHLDRRAVPCGEHWDCAIYQQ